MDTATQIKNNLISRINDSDDLVFLRALQTIFDSSEQALFELNEAQEKSIEIGREQINRGDFIVHEQLMSGLESWLGNK